MKLLIVCISIFICSNLVAQINTDSLRSNWKNTQNSDSARANALDRLASYNIINNSDSAWSMYTRLLSFAEEKKMLLFKAKALNGFCSVKGRIDDQTAAIEYGHQALKIFQEVKDYKGIAGCYINLAGIFYSLGQVKLSLRYLVKGIPICEKYKFIDYLRNGYYFMSYMYYTQKDYADALKYMLKTDSLTNHLGEDDMLENKTNIGIAYHELGQYDKSIAILKQALATQRELNQNELMTNTLMELGNAYGKAGQFDLAIKYLDESVTLADEISDFRQSGYAMMIKGQVYLRMRDYKNAIKWCSEAGKVFPDQMRLVEKENMCDCLYEGYKGAHQDSKALVYLERRNDIRDTIANADNAKLLQQAEFAAQMLADSIATVEKERLIEEAHQEEVRQKNQTRNGLMAGGALVLLLAAGLYSRLRYVRKSKAIVEKEKDRSNNLLLNILPADIAEELKIYGKAEARDFDKVSILFTDFKGFTEQSAKMSAADLVNEINVCFEAFDGIMAKHGVEKIKTIGDAYMAAGGLPVPTDDSVKNTVLAALEMQNFIVARSKEQAARNLPFFEMRVGIHTGPVVAGIVGVKKFQYDIWGDTVNTASRMESAGEVGKVNISQSTFELLKGDSHFAFESRGKIEAKGKGEMEMWFVNLKEV